MLADNLEALGYAVRRIPARRSGVHLAARPRRRRRRAPVQLIVGHYDTVWPTGTLATMPFAIEGDRARGPGVYDMKAGLVIGIAAPRALAATSPSPHRVVMLYTSDEETGSHASRGAIEDEARRSDAVLVLEPALAGGAVKTSRKGVGVFRLDVEGVAAHAGVDPGRGASAIDELAQRTNTVLEPGQFSRRGGLLDLWTPAEKLPVRLDFFGDEIETIRKFDPATQRTIEKLDSILITPAREYIASGEHDAELSEFHIPLLHQQPSSLLDYLPQKAIVLIDDLSIVESMSSEVEEQAVKFRQESIAEETLSPDFPLPYIPWSELRDGLHGHSSLELGYSTHVESLEEHAISGFCLRSR